MKQFIISLIISVMWIPCAYGAGISNLYKVTPAVNVTIDPPQSFSIYTGCDNKVFQGVSDIKVEGNGVWFTHRGMKKYVSGTFWIEPEPPHGPVK